MVSDEMRRRREFLALHPEAVRAGMDLEQRGLAQLVPAHSLPEERISLVLQLASTLVKSLGFVFFFLSGRNIIHPQAKLVGGGWDCGNRCRAVGFLTHVRSKNEYVLTRNPTCECQSCRIGKMSSFLGVLGHLKDLTKKKFIASVRPSVR